MEFALEIKAADRTPGIATRVGLILQALHWTVGGRLKDKARTRFYVRTPKADQKPGLRLVVDNTMLDDVMALI